MSASATSRVRLSVARDPLESGCRSGDFQELAIHKQDTGNEQAMQTTAIQPVASSRPVRHSQRGLVIWHGMRIRDFRKLVKQNPFAGKFEEGRFLHAAWLAEKPAEDAIGKLRALAAAGEEVEVVGKVAYLHTPGGLSQSVLGTKFDKGLGVPNTARNWNTVLKLLELAEKAAN